MHRSLLWLALVIALLIAPVSALAYEGQIDGEFHGWDGETIYKLIDGHIIQQSSYSYSYNYDYSPDVVIYNSSGGLKIHVKGTDDSDDVDIRVLR